jgi:hypothetical protein
VIPTGTGAGTKTPAIRRADELCYSPKSKVVVVANDDPLDNFITFINEDTFGVISRIRFDGTDPNGDNILANGIEQCVYNARGGNFYLAIPNTGPANLATPLPGVVVRISGKAPLKVEKVIADFSKAPLNTTGCTGSTGMAVGPAAQIGLSCGLIINDKGAIVANFRSEGNSGEMWYNNGSNHYFLANSACKQTVTTTRCLGVIDAGPPPSADTVAETAAGSHSVAVDARSNQVLVPIQGNTGQAVTVAPTVRTTCSKGRDVFGLAGSDALGCIASLTVAGQSTGSRDTRPLGKVGPRTGATGGLVWKGEYRAHPNANINAAPTMNLRSSARSVVLATVCALAMPTVLQERLAAT